MQSYICPLHYRHGAALVVTFAVNPFNSSMLSYRHAFHAGNHADVLKHFLLMELIGYLGQKDAPFWYIDTHAGAEDVPPLPETAAEPRP